MGRRVGLDRARLTGESPGAVFLLGTVNSPIASPIAYNQGGEVPI